MAYLLQCALSVGLALWKMFLFYFIEAIIENLDAVILFVIIESFDYKINFGRPSSRGLGKEAGECHAEKRGLDPYQPVLWLLPPLKKYSRCTSRRIACFSLLAWGFSPGELGCTFCAAGTPLSPLTQAHFAFLYWLHNLHPSQSWRSPKVWSLHRLQVQEERSERSKGKVSLFSSIYKTATPPTESSTL